MRRKLEDRLFNGYVREPIPIVLICIALEIVLLVLAIISTWEYAHMSDLSMPAGKLECVITAYEKDGPIYALKTDCGVTVDIPVDVFHDLHPIDLLIEKQDVVSIEYDRPKGEEHLRVDALTIANAEGVPIITADEVLMARKENGKNAQIILWSVCLCYGVMMGVSYYILCNAPKYPRFASFLVREAYRNF